MYKLTPRMLQQLYRNLEKYHELFDGGRCSGWELEEILVKAIKSDTQAQHQVFWEESGHDDKADIRIRTNGEEYPIQIKSGEVKNSRLVLSGHRFSRFEGDLKKITEYLIAKSDNMISVPYEKVDDDRGRQHIYQVSYLRINSLKPNSPQWETKGKTLYHTNHYGVRISLHPSMSWQVWWRIPIPLIEQEEPFIIG